MHLNGFGDHGGSLLQLRLSDGLFTVSAFWNKGYTMQKLNIRYYREVRGLTREELASSVGISNKELFDYENGYQSPHLSTMLIIAKKLNVELADLVRRM